MEVKDILWRLIDNDIPLANDDFTTYLIKDGAITEEDLKAWIEATKKVKEAYKQLPNEALSLNLLNEALNVLNSISPKKPFPPDTKVRFEEVKQNIKKAIEELGKKDNKL